MSQVIVFLSCRTTAGDHFLSEVISLIWRACCSFFMLLSLKVLSCVSLCPNKGCKHEQKVVQTFCLFSFCWFLWLCAFTFPLFLLFRFRLCRLLQTKQNKWKHMKGHLLTDSQNSWLWGHSVSQLCDAHDFHCSQVKIQPKAHREPLRTGSLVYVCVLINTIFILNAKHHCKLWENICNPLFFIDCILQSCWAVSNKLTTISLTVLYSSLFNTNTTQQYLSLPKQWEIGTDLNSVAERHEILKCN